MGEATPAQSAAGPFVPMLGVGLGTMPGGVGNGPVGASARGSSVPQLHNAIVERLRARIELCRRHHSTCENRYQRGQAETSEREHENTLHLLNIVQQGTGNRKPKGSRGSNQQPPEYSRANGMRKCTESDQKNSTRTAVSWWFVIDVVGVGLMNKENLILDKSTPFFITKDQIPLPPKMTKANQNDTKQPGNGNFALFKRIVDVEVMIQTQHVLVTPSAPRKWFVVQCAAGPMTEISCVQLFFLNHVTILYFAE